MSDEFAERLKTVRATLNLTQSELAEKSGLPTSTIAQFETNARKPSFDTLRKLSKALKVSTDYLLGTVDEPQASVSFRDSEKITDHDRELIQDIISMMAKRNQKDGETT